MFHPAKVRTDFWIHKGAVMKKRILSCAAALSVCAGLIFPSAALDVGQARSLLSEHFIEPLSPAAQQAETLDDLFAALNDPYTIYYSPEQYTALMDSINGEQVVGIGITIHNAFDNGFEVISTIPNGPAYTAGIQGGDRIIAVDGVLLTEQDNIVSRLTGQVDSAVQVTVLRPGTGELEFSLVRAVIEVPLVEFTKIDSTGYFYFTTFGDTTADEISGPILYNDRKTAVWIMDLRENPGGTTDSAAQTASHFVGGQTMAYFRDGQDNYYISRTHPMTKDMTDKPLIILTSPDTASSSEMFAGSIRDHLAGIALGQRTYGKGSAQIILDQDSHPEIFNGDALRITTYRFFSPGGMTCHLMGVLPTLVVAPEYTDRIYTLLSSPADGAANGRVKLELAGQTFYISAKAIHKDPQALAHLLEALPPDAKLYLGHSASTWNAITPAQLAVRKKLDYTPRTFSDVSGHPYQRELDILATYDLLSGDGSGAFMPNENMTRAQLAAMLSRVLNLSAPGMVPEFSDVPADAWYADCVGAVTARGFMTGKGSGTFDPNGIVTSQELFCVLSTISEWCSMTGKRNAEESFTAYQWMDFYSYPEWAQVSARNMEALGLNVDRENPSASVTRGTAAGMLGQLMETLGMFWF